jgi:SPFH domain / Band 7 family
MMRVTLKSGLTVIGLLVLGLSGGCQAVRDIRTDSVTSTNRGWSIGSGYEEYDRYTQRAFHISNANQSAIFSQSANEGSNIPDAIDINNNGVKFWWNLTVRYRFIDTQEAVTAYIQNYRVEDEVFKQEQLRQAIKDELKGLVQGKDPRKISEEQEKILDQLTDKLRQRFGKFLKVETIENGNLTFGEKLDAALGAASEAIAVEKALSDPQVVKARKAAIEAFKEKPPAMIRMEQENKALEKGMNPFQPTYSINNGGTAPAAAQKQEEQK